MQNNVLLAFGLTTFAGLSTGIGSAIAFFSKRTNKRFLSGALGFSAGVMLYLSFAEILTKATAALVKALGSPAGNWAAVGSFFGGILVIAVIDLLVPDHENPHEAHVIEEMKPAARADALGRDERLMRMGLFTALAIAIHNFPEGLATFAATLADPKLGVSTAVAIAIHNIPEGISVSVPIFYATGNRRKAFTYSFLSGLAEPIGAGMAYLGILFFLGGTTEVIPPQIMGVMFGGVAGIMVYISLDELLPTSRAYGIGHDSLFGLIGGMAVMALSLLLMR